MSKLIKAFINNQSKEAMILEGNEVPDCNIPIIAVPAGLEVKQRILQLFTEMIKNIRR